MSSRRHGQLHREDGASLLLVIIFVMVFGVITGVILDLANTGFKATTETTKIRNEQQAIESAMDRAINAARGSSSAGYTGSEPCGTSYQKDDLVADGAPVLSNNPVDVTCAPEGERGDASPTYAVLAVGEASGDGIRGIGGDDNGIAITGGIQSNSVIDPGGGGNRFLRIFGDASASSGCASSGRVLLTGLLRCDGVHVDTPDYPSAATTTTGMDVPEPGIPCTGGVATFSPGLYTEVLFSTTVDTAYLTTSCPIWHLTPGNYYFDLPPGQNVVVPAGVTVVGGTRSGTTCSPDQPGVQLIFGGETRLVVNGSIEACAGPNQGGGATPQRIVVYGLTAGSRCPDGMPFPCLSDAALTVHLPIASATFGNSGGIVANDGNVANVDLNGDGQQDATIGALSAGGPAIPFFNLIPDGATLGHVIIDVRHVEQGAFGWKLRPKLTVKVGNRTHVFDVDTSPALPNRGGMTTDSFDLTVLAPDLIRPQFGYLDLNSLEVSYSVDGNALNPTLPPGCGGVGNPCTGPETAQAQVDSISLRVQRILPGFEAHRCAGGGLACSIFDNTGSGGGDKAVLQGTVYTPTAGVDLAARSGLSRFTRGVIASRVAVTPQNDIGADHPVFSVPGLAGDAAGKTGRVAVLTAAVSGKARLRARVVFDDSSGVPGAGAVKIVSWTWL